MAAPLNKKLNKIYVFSHQRYDALGMPVSSMRVLMGVLYEFV